MLLNVRDLSDQFLASWPLPRPGGHFDKEERGHALVVAGSREVPGAALLAVNAAFRAGCGKVTLLTAASVATAMGIAIPEARVLGLPEGKSGGLSCGREVIHEVLASSTAILVGPGLSGVGETCELTAMVLEGVTDQCVVLDALAMDVMHSAHMRGKTFAQKVLMTPHAGEMAHLTGQTKDSVCDRPLEAARALVRAVRACVLLKGAETFLVPTQGEEYRHVAKIPGLAVSGSGDVLAGLITGLLARGASLEQAAAWAVVTHALAGKRLATSKGAVGYLAREVAAEVPAVLQALAAPRPSGNQER